MRHLLSVVVRLPDEFVFYNQKSTADSSSRGVGPYFPAECDTDLWSLSELLV